MRDDNCLFCKIVGGDIPSNKLYEDELCYAFYDIAPQAPTHFLVIPKDHIGSVAEVNGGNSAVVAHIFEVIARLCREQGLESYRVVSNIGEQAGQSVHHLHFHVLSGRDMTWPPGYGHEAGVLSSGQSPEYATRRDPIWGPAASVCQWSGPPHSGTGNLPPRESAPPSRRSPAAAPTDAEALIHSRRPGCRRCRWRYDRS